MNKNVLLCLILLTQVFLVACQATQGSAHLRANLESLDDKALLQRAWEHDLIEFSISDTVPDEWVDAILRSFAMWESQAGRRLFHYKGRIESAVVWDGEGSDRQWGRYDGKNVVYFDSSRSPQGHLGDTHFSHRAGIMEEADIVLYGHPTNFAELNCEDPQANCRVNAGRYDLVTTALHEIGHFLGFEHSGQEGHIMNPNFSLNDVVHDFDLAGDMIAELHQIYNPTYLAAK
jgi:hypothetical protein